MLRVLLLTVFAGALCQSQAVGQSLTPVKQDPRVKTVYRLDSAILNRPDISADGRLVVFQRYTPPSGGSIWTAVVPNGKPIRLTSDGFDDAFPVFSPLGDRVFFMSDRASHGSPTKNYVMSVDIEPRTGAPVGPPRQVTTDEIVAIRGSRPVRAVSWDGRWIAYVPDPKTLKIVPANGGLAVSLARAAQEIAGTAFSRDNKWVYFQDASRNANAGVLKKVSVEGGPATVVVESKDSRVRAWPAEPERGYLLLPLTPGGASHFELRDYTGKVLGRNDIPPTNWQVRADGYGYSGSVGMWRHQLKAAPLDGGPVRTLTPPLDFNPVGFLSNGTIVGGWADADGQVTLATLEGSIPSHAIKLSREVRNLYTVLTAGSAVVAQGAGSAPGLGSLYLIAPETGALRTITRTAVPRGCCFVDDRLVGFAEVVGDSVAVRSIDASGATRLVWTLDRTDFDSLAAFSLRGDLFAFGRRSARRDSVIFSVGRLGQVARVVGAMPVRDHSACASVGLSPKADWLVAIGCSAESSEIRTIAFPMASGKTTPPVVLHSGLEDWDDNAWLPDGSGIVLLGSRKGQRKNTIVRVPLDPTRPATSLAAGETGDITDIGVGPDRKLLYYGLMVPHGSSIYTADFIPGLRR